MDKFDEKFPCKCMVCGNSGVNCQGECKCSYEVSTEIIEKPTEIKSFIESTIREVLKSIQEIELAPDEKTLKLLAELDNKTEAFGFGQGWVCNKLEENIEKILT